MWLKIPPSHDFLKIFLLIFIFFCWIDENDAEDLSKNFYRISQINEEQPSYGTYQIQGYVIWAYSCPQCFSGVPAECEACTADYIVVSEENKILQEGVRSEKELMIFVGNAFLFELGHRYTFLIQILDVKNMPQRVHNVKLIYFKENKGGQ